MPFELWLCALYGPNNTQVEQIMALTIHIFFNVLYILSVLVGTGITYLFSSISPRVTKSLNASAYYLGKKERDFDTFNECATSLPRQQTSQQQCFPQPKTLSTSISFVPNIIFILCKSDIPNQELIEPVGHSWSACDDGLVTPTMHTRASIPVEVRDLTHLYCTYKECVYVRKCSCLLVGLLCVDACSCTNYVN